MPSYNTLQWYAIAISIVSVIYNGAEGVIGIVFGAEGDNRSLVFFGIQSGIEVISAIIVVFRFRKAFTPGKAGERELTKQELKYE